MGFLRQTWVLTLKDLKIVALRRWFSTFLRAAALPVLYMVFISYVRTFFLPPSQYGFGVPRPIRNLTTEVFNSSTSLGGRDRVVLINDGLTGGQIDTLIDRLAGPLTEAGADVRLLSSEDDLLQTCQSSLAGFSRCFASASFHSSPTEGPGGAWSYTARVDGGLGLSVFVNQDDNAAQVYVLPFVQAIDAEIARLGGTELPSEFLEQPFTYETIQDREDEVQRFYTEALGDYLAVTLFIAVCGITFHLPGYMAVERESGISSLVDVMSFNSRPWITLTSRLLSTYSAFFLIYLPGLIGVGAVVSETIFVRTPASIILPFHILLGMSLLGFSMFLASFFRRAQLSGITVLILSLVSAVILQFVPRTPTAIGVVSAIFPPATYTAFIIQIADFETFLEPARLNEAPVWTTIGLQGYVFYVLLAAQIVVYPVLAGLVQYVLHSPSRNIREFPGGSDAKAALRLNGVSKTFGNAWWHRWFTRKPNTVKAVNNLDFAIMQGQLMALLGVNGSGKSTLLAGLTGTQSFTKGTIEVGRGTHIGLCPQVNVAWSDLSVQENVSTFARLKAGRTTMTRSDVENLIAACDLSEKSRARPHTLSGGQQRKLQLALAFAGGSTICCIDEASSGLDPLSRRKIWEILLAEKGRRTIILTTHALDEADALSDHIAVMSKGHLLVEGSSAELKQNHGGGYRISLPVHSAPPADLSHLQWSIDGDNTVTRAHDSAAAIEVAQKLESHGLHDISVRCPSMEDVFLGLVKESQDGIIGDSSSKNSSTTALSSERAVKDSDQDTTVKQNGDPGKGTGFAAQVFILFRKRLMVAKRNYLPYIFALIVPLITAGLGGYYFLQGFDGLPCSLGAASSSPQTLSLGALERYWGILVPVGPSDRFDVSSLPPQYLAFNSRLRRMDDYAEFDDYIHNNFRNVVPGGFYLGDNATAPPLMAYRINGNAGYAALAKNVADSYLSNITINADFSNFALPFTGSTGDSLQLILYLCLALCAFPAFLALYPTYERLANVRALHYTTGVRPAPLWLAYWLFDGMTVTVVSIAVIAVLTGISNVWYAPGYLFVVIFLYGLTSTLLAYVVSLFSKTQLAAFATVAGYQAISMLLNFIMYMVLLTFGTAEQLQNNLNTVQYTYGLIAPAGTLLRALLLALNQSQLLCRQQSFVSYPGNITVYGAPILYLLLQIFALYAFLVAYESGWRPPVAVFWRKSPKQIDTEKDVAGLSADAVAEESRAEASQDELRLLHVRKDFGRRTVVDNVTLGVGKGEVLGLLGRNGAGKTTLIGLIRGVLNPSSRDSEILIANASVRRNRLAARRYLGVCPQFNASDRLTVNEHMRFYARIRGVPDIHKSAETVMRAVGLSQYGKRLIPQLSGGNQRKLSLATAIIGNPSVVLLDEPSSGMDALAMRTMWRAISDVSGERAVVITTHSMEEASALSDRVAIMDRRVLALGSPAHLRDRYGRGTYQVHAVHSRGSMARMEELHAIRDWVVANCPGARLPNEPETVLHGQLRFQLHVEADDGAVSEKADGTARPTNHFLVLLKLLEEAKARFGVAYYSVSHMTLEDIFLDVAAKGR